MPELDVNDHHVGAGFDRRLCTGEHPAVGSPCPYFVGEGEELPAEMQGSLVDKIGGAVDSERCGACGCPMTTLALFEAPPTEAKGCPRVDQHREYG